MRPRDSRYGTNPAIVPGAIQKNTNDPSTAPTVLVTLLLPHHASVFAERTAHNDAQLSNWCFRHQLLLGRQRDFLNRKTDRRGCVEEHEYDFLRRQKKLPR